jgi:hypothetical protein
MLLIFLLKIAKEFDGIVVARCDNIAEIITTNKFCVSVFLNV